MEQARWSDSSGYWVVLMDSGKVLVRPPQGGFHMVARRAGPEKLQAELERYGFKSTRVKAKKP